jgi:hypothetical protein
MNSARPGERSARPSASKRSWACGTSRGSTLSESASAASPIGMLMKKIQRRETSSTSQPPRIGPTIGPRSIGTPMMLMTRPTRCGPAAGEDRHAGRHEHAAAAALQDAEADERARHHAMPERIEPHSKSASDSK